MLFGAAAERAGGIRQTEVAVVEEGTTIGELWDALTELHPGLVPLGDTLAFAVNGEYARMEAAVSPGDEVAVLPPVSGG